VPAHVTKNGANGGQNGGHYRQTRGKTVATVLSDMLNFVVVRAVYVKSMTRHSAFSLRRFRVYAIYESDEGEFQNSRIPEFFILSYGLPATAL
jgi:hypothetical protein